MTKRKLPSIAPDRQALEDQILAVLQSQRGFLGVHQICEAVGPWPKSQTHRCGCGHEHIYIYARILWNVERLEVERGPLNPTGSHVWRAT